MKHVATLTAMALSALLSAPGRPADAQPAGCPPGLAKKTPACTPPGRAKEGVTTKQWLTRHRIAERVEPDTIVWVDDLARYELPELSDGRRHAKIDGMLVALDPESYEILQLVRSATAVLR
ncbi:hypothetical protein [Palleronia sp.]|uniref:hypothetical protein n=1 Tax=Palleronia sp. TaxID=1940284 RepID=UPI0035C827E5